MSAIEILSAVAEKRKADSCKVTVRCTGAQVPLIAAAPDLLDENERLKAKLAAVFDLVSTLEQGVKRGAGCCNVEPGARLTQIREFMGHIETEQWETDQERMFAEYAVNNNLRALNAELVEALEGMTTSTDAYTVHNEDCSRGDECDDAKEKPDECCNHGSENSGDDECPGCECGITEIVLANEKARAVLAKAKGEG